MVSNTDSCTAVPLSDCMQFRAADCGLIIFYLVHPTRKYKECLDTHIYTQIIPMFVYMKVPGPRLMCVILYLYYFSMSHVCTFIINTRVVYILSGATIENKSLAKPGKSPFSLSLSKTLRRRQQEYNLIQD